VLWGTSFGSLICLAVATRHRERVSGMLMSFPPAPGWRPQRYMALLRYCASRPQPARATARMFQAAFLGLNAWEFFLPTALRRLPALARASADASTPATTVQQKLQLLWHEDPGMPSPQQVPPSAIIAGRFDLVAPLSGARRLAALLGARLHVLDVGGHAGAYSRPRAYASWAIAELQRLAPGRDDSGSA
jgi:pimeloyl-ACP methyl ester carboxylesterase